MSNRREFFKKAGLLSLSTIVTNLVSAKKLNALDSIANQSVLENPAYTLLALPYAYNALEPFIDEQTMTIHHTKHHQAYVNKLNETKSTNINYQVNDIEKCKQLDAAITNSVIRNNLGGHVNHSLFWLLLKPNPNAEINLPHNNLAKAITTEFKSVEEFKKQFAEKATKHFGSGWCWLVLRNNKLIIETTPNQDNPFMRKSVVDNDVVKIILALDVWEHAYYLKHQNKRADYINNWWNIVNWTTAEEHYNSK